MTIEDKSSRAEMPVPQEANGAAVVKDQAGSVTRLVTPDPFSVVALLDTLHRGGTHR